jgi:hypothetical protein
MLGIVQRDNENPPAKLRVNTSGLLCEYLRNAYSIAFI